MAGIMMMHMSHRPTVVVVVANAAANIVTTNLVLHLDANSYSTGTNWPALVGSNATIQNAASLPKNSTQGYITFSQANSQWASVPDIGSISRFTVEAWFRPSSVPIATNPSTTAVVTNQFNGSVLNYSIGLNNAPTDYNVGVGFFDGAWRRTSGIAPTANTWYHVVGTYDGTNLTMYKDGVQYAQAAYNNLTPTSGGQIRIAARWDDQSAGNYFPGDIGAVRIYNRALSNSEALQNYATEAPRFSIVNDSSLQFNLAYAPMSNTWLDISGNGRHATVNGNTTYSNNNFGGVKLQNLTYGGTGYISVPYNINSNTVTVEIVGSFSPTSTWATIFGNEGYNAGAGYFAYMTSGTSVTFGKPGGTSTAAITQSNAIRHWVFVFNGTNQKLYINGTQVANSAVITQTVFTSNNTFFGARHVNDGSATATDMMNNSNTSLQPVFYQMRMYNKSLTAAEVTQNYNAMKPIYGI